MLLLFVLILTSQVFGETIDFLMPVDSLLYHSDFHHSQDELDSLLSQSPQLVLLKEKIRHRNVQNSFLSRTSIHLSYDPFNDFTERNSGRLWLSLNLPLRMFEDTRPLEKVEIQVELLRLKVEARELMKQRNELLIELGLDIQRYSTLLLKLQKAKTSLAIKDISSDEMLEAKDHLAELLTSITKKKLQIRLLEDRLKGLLGEL